MVLTQNKSIDLVKGYYTKNEAREILLNLLNSKINFHELRKLSLDERFGLEDEVSKRRIVELKDSKENLIDLFDSISPSAKIRVDSVINIVVEE